MTGKVRCFLVAITALGAVLIATAQVPATAETMHRDYHALSNLNEFTVSGNNGQTIIVTLPDHWKVVQYFFQSWRPGQSVIVGFNGQKFATLNGPTISDSDIGGAVPSRTYEFTFICEGDACPVTIRLARWNDTAPAVTANTTPQPPPAQPVPQPTPQKETSLTPYVVIGILVILFILWMIGSKIPPKEPTPSVPPLAEPDPILAPASPISSFEESISIFSIVNHSPHVLMEVPPNGKTLLMLGLPEDHNSEENQNKIAEQVRQLLSKAPGEITPYQVPHQDTYEQAIRGELSAFVGSLGIPTYFYGLEILPTDSIPLGLRQDCEEDGLIIDTIPYFARTRHVYATGRSGSGKSTLLKALALKDIQHYKGIAVIDPHGDLAESILNSIPNDQASRAIYISAENAVPIDFMSFGNVREKEALVGDIIFLLQRFPGWGPRMDSILRDVLYTLLEAGDTCFLDIYHFLVDKERRNQILSRVKDRDLLRTWNENFPRPDAIEPILNRMKVFVRSASFQTFMGGGQSQLDLYEVMQEGKILLVNLATAGRESGDLLGALIVSKLQQACGRRQPIPANQRRPFYIYTDEFQRFQTTSFEFILSETRKYEVGLVMANQFPDQLESNILSSVIGNVSTMFLFQLDPKDARHFVGGITMRPPKQELMSKIKWNPDSLTMEDFARAKRPVPPELLSEFPIGCALYKPLSGDAHITCIFPNESASDPNTGDLIRLNTLAQYGLKRIVDNSSCASPQVPHTEGNDDEPQPGAAPSGN